MQKHVPLTTLLSWVLIANTIEVDNAVEALGSRRTGRHFRLSMPMWSNGLRFIDEDGITVGELRSSAHAVCNIGGLERWGWISVGSVSGPRRPGYGTHRGVKGDTKLYPTRAGLYARRLWPRVISGVEDGWRSRFGGELIDALVDSLRPVRMGMPWSPPEVNPSDGFFSHIVNGDDAGTVDRPLVALQGQSLTAMTVDVEQKARVSLPLGANILRVIGPEEVRLRDLPVLTGISKAGVSMAVSYLVRKDMADPIPGRGLRLTDEGLRALDRYTNEAAAMRDDRLRDALERILEQHDALSAGLVPPEGCWRSENPYAAQTRRFVADPTGALPWHPMILHRGGWPDAN